MNKEILKKLIIGEVSFLRVMRSIFFIYACVGLYAYFFSDRMIFLPQPSTYQDNNRILKLTTKDGVKISAVYLPNPQAKFTILYSHGNAEDLGDNFLILEELRNLGFSVFAYDYRGYGTSQGKPTEKAAYKDIDAAYDYLTQNLGVSPEKIILYGRSVGGGPSVDLGSRKPVGGLILENTFVSTFRVVTQITLFPFDKFNNIAKIKKVHSPVLVMYGKADKVIPFWHGEKLFAAANEPKRVLVIEAAGHNDFRDTASTEYDRALREFTQLISQHQSK
ncbi:alpha/beta hydrolase [Phormidium sp. LEGE 05292]|uniref:alpha/beta hydrolase n=1 Tax=[Phormidium] sp. LEGE 05292 TaxID=767427 RepID=UPI0018826734|nr:alpha/beta hydrolase [Phormidium sp. LEGE 05292]MBE9229652.1 alpha/beta hydrolase [Phormidium sp. LEGE 05292]